MSRLAAILGVLFLVSCSNESNEPAPEPGDDPACDVGLALCDGECIDLTSDPGNCGQCGEVCSKGKICTDGVCVPACDDGLEHCDGSCVDLDSDAKNCGGCGVACDESEICAGGECEERCPGGIYCDGECIDPDTNSAHCGSCGNACAEHLTCVEGSCACPEGQEECNGECIDVQDDPLNCGACGRTCLGGANSTGGTCESGACVLSCEDGWTDCDGNPENGCEAQLDEDLNNCGTCGTVCAVPDQVDAVLCVEGACEIAQCQDGWEDCDFDYETGCEVNLNEDSLHCGICDNSCLGLANNEADVCVEGGCEISCEEGWGDCDEVAANGCETDILRERQHCGVCGNSCDAFCEDGVCQTIAQLIGGNDYTCVRWDVGQVHCWGSNGASWSVDPEVTSSAAPLPVIGGVAKLGLARAGTNCAIMNNGELWCWGVASALIPEAEGMTPPLRVEGLPEDQSIVDVVSASESVCALTSDKEIWCWGMSHGLGHMLPDSTWLPPARIDGIADEVVEITVATGGTYCARTVEGEVWCWGLRIHGEEPFTFSPNPELLPGLPKVVSLGYGSTVGVCAIVEDGEVMCWGANQVGELGSEQPFIPPTTIPGLSGVTWVGTGADHSCALTDAGEVYCWGNNEMGQLGREGESSIAPVRVANVSDVVEVSTSGSHSCARKANDEIVCWGMNDAGQLGNGSTGGFSADATVVDFAWDAVEDE